MARYTTLLCCSAIAAATLIAYSALLLPGFEFLSWDDTTNIVDNPVVSNPAALDLASLWGSTTLGVYEPLGTSLKLLLVEGFGMRVQPFHVTTLLLHLINGCVLFLVSRRLILHATPAEERDTRRANLAALCAGLCFSLHPLRVEVVGWASGQSYALATTFFLLSLAAYLRHCEAMVAQGAQRGPTRYLALSAIAYAGAVLSKSAAIFLPAVLLVLDYYPLRRRHWRRLILEKAAYVVIAAGTAGVAFWSTQGAQRGNSLDLDFTTRLAYSLQSFLFHLRLSLWPDRLLPSYPLTQEVATPLDESFLIYSAGVAALCLLAWRLRNRAPWFTACWLAYVAGILPVSGLIPHGAWTLGADRYTYMTTFGFFILLGGALASPSLLPRTSLCDPRARAIALGLALTLGVLGLSTHRQLQHWKNTEALWRHTLAHDPANPMALNNLGYHYLALERHDEAIPLFETVVAVDPGNLKAVLNLGYSLERAGRLEQAVGSYKRALMRHPDSGALHNNIGVIYHKLGVHEAARRHAELATAKGFRRAESK